MSRVLRIAFAATYTLDAQPDTKPRILLIGTVDDAGKDWRYATWPLDALLEKIREPDQARKLDPFAAGANVLFHDGVEGDPALPSVAAGEDDPGAAGPSTVLINHVSVLVVSPAGPGLGENDGWEGFGRDRLARLDTVARALDEADNALDPDQWRVSSVRLVHRTGVGAEPGELLGFDLRAFVRMPLGAHAKTVGRNRGDRFDTRLILRMTGKRGTAGRPLGQVARGAAVAGGR